MTFRDRLAEIEARISRACDASGRAREDVLLIAVSKTHDASTIRAAYADGQRHFGENYAQEFAAKAEALADLPDIVWHFIGHLQSNKAKVVATHAHVVHTVDRIELARELAKRALVANRTPLDVLLEANLGGEAQKHGASASSLPALVSGVRALEALNLRGLMTVPPHDEAATEAAFTKLASLAKTYALADLSMGMSQDLETAIACGATMIRVGTALFGARAT